MRNSSNNLILGALIAFGIGVISLFLCQSVWLQAIAYLIGQHQSSGLPASTTPVSGFTFPTSAPPAPAGHEVRVGNLSITVTKIWRPADTFVGNTQEFPALDEDGEEYLMVDVHVYCTSSTEVCHVSELDFAVRTESGREYPAEFSTSFPNLKPVFEGGTIDPGAFHAGWLVFIIHGDDTGLIMVYPRMFGFGNTGQFDLEP